MNFNILTFRHNYGILSHMQTKCITYISKRIVLLLFFVSSSSVSQETWSLEECISYAIEYNLTLKDFEYNEATDKENYKQSIRDLLPTANAFAGYSLSFGRAADPNSNTFIDTDFFSNNYSLNSSIDLFRGFQRINSIKATKYLYKAAKEDIKQEKYLLAFRVMSAFYDIKFFEGLVANSEEQQNISQNNYDLVKRQIELGLKAGADLYEAESLLLTDQLTLVQSENSLQEARLKLIQEMNLKGATTIAIQPSLDDINFLASEATSPQQDSIYRTAVAFIPIIKAQQLRTKAAKKDVAIARGTLYPSLSLSAGYGTGYFETIVNTDTGETIPFRDQIRDNASRFVGVSLNVPLINKWTNRSTIKQQKIAFKRAKNALEVQEQELYQLIQQLVQTQNSLLAEVAQSGKKMESQEVAFQIAQKRYEKGLINALDLFEAKNLYATAQNENLIVRLRLRVNDSTLDFYRGLPVFNINNTK